jgi:hypothetical protein
MSSGITFTALVVCPGATTTPTNTPTSTATPTLTATVTPTNTVTPTVTPIDIDNCNSSVHEMNAYDDGHPVKQYYVNVGTTSGTLTVTVQITSQDDLQDCLLFTYGDVILVSQCMGGSGHTVGTIINISIPYIYDANVGPYVKVVQSTDTTLCCSDPNAESFISSVGLTGSTEQNSIRNLVANLKYNNLWSKFLYIHPIIGGTNDSHTYNLVTQSNFNTTLSTGGSVHTASGITWSAASVTRARVLEFYPATSGLFLNDTHIAHYNLYDRQDGTTAEMGVSTGADGLFIQTVGGSGGGALCAVNGNQTSQVSCTGTSGFWMANRISSSSVSLYRNGNDLYSGGTSNTSVALCSTQRMYHGLRNSSGFAFFPSNNTVAFYSCGAGMTDTQANLYYRIVQNYQRRLNRAV